MKDKLLFILLFCVLLLGCSKEQKIEKKIVNKPQQKDYSYIKIDKKISEEDKEYFQKVNEEINTLSFKWLLKESLNKKDCEKLHLLNNNLFAELEISPEKEAVRNRIIDLRSPCLQYSDLKFKDFSDDEWNYLETKSILPYATLTLAENNFRQAKEAQEVKKRQELIQLGIQHLNQAYNLNPNNLYTLKRALLNIAESPFTRLSKEELAQLDFTMKEYCQKAVETKQWDHIYYLTMDPIYDFNIEQVPACFDPKYKHNCKCPEAMRLVLKHVPKETLLSPEFINPHAEEEPEGEDGTGYYLSIRDLVLKETSRDLKKEKMCETYHNCNNKEVTLCTYGLWFDYPECKHEQNDYC